MIEDIIIIITLYIKIALNFSKKLHVTFQWQWNFSKDVADVSASFSQQMTCNLSVLLVRCYRGNIVHLATTREQRGSRLCSQVVEEVFRGILLADTAYYACLAIMQQRFHAILLSCIIYFLHVYRVSHSSLTILKLTIQSNCVLCLCMYIYMYVYIYMYIYVSSNRSVCQLCDAERNNQTILTKACFVHPLDLYIFQKEI